MNEEDLTDLNKGIECRHVGDHVDNVRFAWANVAFEFQCMQEHRDGCGKSTEDQQQVDVSDLFFVSSIEEAHVVEEKPNVMLRPDVEHLGDHCDNVVEPSIRNRFVLVRIVQRITKTGFRPQLTDDVR